MTSNNFQSLVAIILTAVMFGVTFGLTIPLVSLVLDSWGTSETVIGLIAATPGLAALLFVPFYARLLSRIGLVRMLMGCMTLVVTTLLLFSFIPVVSVWFVLRFLNGAGAIGLFMTSELWVNQIAPEVSRGRIVAIFATAVSIGFVTGPIILSMVGVQGPAPFLIAAGLIMLAGVPLSFARGFAPEVEHTSDLGMWDLFHAAPIIIFAALLDGLLFMGAQSLLPVYALKTGLAAAEAARTIAWFAVGMLLMPLVIGAAADRWSREWLLILVAAITAVLFWTLPLGFSTPIVRAIVLILIGGMVNVVYTVALTMIGERFRGPSLATATAVLTGAFAVGEIVGPTLVGVATDIAPAGYYISLATICTVFAMAGALVKLRGVRSLTKHP